MKVYELEYLLKDLLSDANIDILHVTPRGFHQSYSVVNVSEDALGAHLIIASKRKLAEDAIPECGQCGKRLRNPNTRKEWEGGFYCHPPMMLKTCWNKATKGEL